MSSPALTSIDQEIESELRNGDDTEDDNDDIWKNTDDILSGLEATLSNFKKKEDSRQSPTNPESGKENTDSNDPGDAKKYMDQVSKTPTLQSSLSKNDLSRQEKVLHKAETSHISTDNQTPPGSKRKRIANRKYINDEFDDSSSPRRNKINASISSNEKNDKTDDKTNTKRNNLGKVVATQKINNISLKAKSNNATGKEH